MRENEANCEQIKSEMQQIQRKPREFAKQKERKTSTTEPAATESKPESRMEVDEIPRSSGRFNLDRVAQEHMNEGLKVRIAPEPVPSVRSLDTQPIWPLVAYLDCARRAPAQVLSKLSAPRSCALGPLGLN